VLVHRAGKLVARLPGDPAAIRTRWRTLRRALVALIVLVGMGIALSYIPGTSTPARTALASSAVLVVVIGFAAQSTLSNAVSGLLLAFAQPIRIGDHVTIEGRSGVVEDIGLTYTYLRGDDARRLIYPNSVLAQKTIENATIRGGESRVRVRVPTEHGPKVAELRARLDQFAVEAGLRAPETVVAELAAAGPVLEVRGWAPNFAAARAAEDQLRAAVVGAMQ
jgi:small-conductance mechanosensitive channel